MKRIRQMVFDSYIDWMFQLLYGSHLASSERYRAYVPSSKLYCCKDVQGSHLLSRNSHQDLLNDGQIKKEKQRHQLCKQGQVVQDTCHLHPLRHGPCLLTPRK